MTTLAALRTMPVLGMNLIDLGEKLSFLSSAEANTERQKVVIAAINSRTVEGKDLVCSRSDWAEISAKDLKSEAFSNGNSLQAMSCLKTLPTGISGNQSIQAAIERPLTDKNTDTRSVAAWLIGMTESADSKAQQTLLKMLSDKNDGVRPMAAWALHRVRNKDAETLKALARQIGSPDEWVRRDIVTALALSRSKDTIITAALQKAKTDKDSIVQAIASHALDQATPEKVDEQTWQDKQTKQVWHYTSKAMNQYEAEVFCEEKA